MKPFLHGKKTALTPSLSGRQAQPAAVSGVGQVVRARPAAETAASPSIDVIKEGDKVVRLVITCSCGERMEVECIYPAGA